MRRLQPEDDVVLVINARIGDTLLATPAMRAIKAAVGQGVLEVLAHPKRELILQNLDFIDRLGSITKNSAPWRAQLKRNDADFAIVYGKDRRLLEYALRRAKRVVAFEYAENRRVSSRLHLVPPPEGGSMHAVRERLLLAEAIGAQPVGLQLAYRVSAAERSAADEWLMSIVVPGSAPIVGLQMYSFATKSHRDWPEDYFIALVKKLLATYQRSHLIILGDAVARRRALERFAAVRERCTVAAGLWDIRGSAALISRLDLFVGVDTGPTHIAGALGVPMVALYHPAYPGCNLVPLDHPRCQIVEHPAKGHARAPEAHMREIEVDIVWRAVRNVLDGSVASV